MKVLNGWKEIARHLGRGVRTAQRWENYGLPVHRPRGARRSAVTTTAEELDKWFMSTPVNELGGIAELQKRIAELEKENESLRENCGHESGTHPWPSERRVKA